MKLTQEYVKAILDYNPDTGILTWKYRADAEQRWNTRFAGKEAGYIATPGGMPRRYITINGILYLNARVIWLWHYGDPIPVEIDHEDTNSLNDRIKNLRSATHSENSKNRSAYNTNTSGIKGVYWVKAMNKWKAAITVDYKQVHLGYFNTIEEATAARREATIKYHGIYGRHE